MLRKLTFYTIVSKSFTLNFLYKTKSELNLGSIFLKSAPKKISYKNVFIFFSNKKNRERNLIYFSISRSGKFSSIEHKLWRIS